MSLETACDLSISDLLHALRKKLKLVHTGLRETHLPPRTVRCLGGIGGECAPIGRRGDGV
jgi:hypothetical protein